MQNNGYSGYGYPNPGAVNNGFSNPFGNSANSNNNFSQGYTGYNSFVVVFLTVMEYILRSFFK